MQRERKRGIQRDREKCRGRVCEREMQREIINTEMREMQRWREKRERERNAERKCRERNAERERVCVREKYREVEREMHTQNQIKLHAKSKTVCAPSSMTTGSQKCVTLLFFFNFYF